MRRILLGSLAVVLLTAPSAHAQACLGLPSFSTSPLQATGEASVTGESSAIGGGLAYGLPRGPFGEVAAASRRHENFGGSSLDLSGGIGYQFAAGQGARVHLCPLAAGELQIGPNNAYGSDVERSRRSARIGLQVGTELSPLRRWNVIPAFGLSYAYQRDQAKDAAGTVLFQIDDYYTLAQLSLGLVFKSTLSLRPYVDLPLWLQGGEPTVGLVVGYGFGRRAGS